MYTDVRLFIYLFIYWPMMIDKDKELQQQIALPKGLIILSKLGLLMLWRMWHMLIWGFLSDKLLYFSFGYPLNYFLELKLFSKYWWFWCKVLIFFLLGLNLLDKKRLLLCVFELIIDVVFWCVFWAFGVNVVVLFSSYTVVWFILWEYSTYE